MEHGVMTKSRSRIPRRPVPVTGVVRAEGHGFSTDAFFRHIVSGMRNGVLAITRDGSVALINDEAYRIFGIPSMPDAIGQPLATVLKDHPDVVRVLTGAFDLHHLPNRVEMRLKPSNKVKIGRASCRESVCR